MPSFRKLMLVLMAISCLLLLPQMAAADPIHSHCATSPWTLTRNPAVRISESDPDIGSFTITLGPIQFDQLPPMIGDCVYETSDITSIDITLNFTNTGGLIEATVSGSNVTKGKVFNPIGSATFAFPNGQAGPTLQFTLHTVGAAFHVIPGELFAVTLISSSPLPQGVTATITASGNHYYEVPEPATMLLLGTGLAGVAIKMRKRLKTRKKEQGSQ